MALALDDDSPSPTPPPTTGTSETTDTTTTPPTTGTSETTDTTTPSTTGTSAAPDVTAPVVSLDTPSEGSVIPTRTPEFAGTAGVEPGDAVEVLVEIVDENGRPLAASPLSAPVVDGAWTVTPTPALLDGSYQATARQSDGEGNTGSSATHTFSVDTRAPGLTLRCPSTTSSLTIRCKLTSTEAGTASFAFTLIRLVSEKEEVALPSSNDQTVELKADTEREFPLTLPQPSETTFPNSVPTAFVIVAVQTDEAGNSGRSERTQIDLDLNPVT